MFSLWKWSTDRRVGPTMSYWEKGSPGRNGPRVTWRFRESGPPSTRKGYAAAVSGKAANGGRRAAAPTRCSAVRKAAYFFFSFPRKGDAAALNGGAIKSRPVDRARPVCLRPKSRRFAAVGLRHAPAGAVSFSSGKKNRGPRAACRVGRGGRNGAERSPRR